MKDEINDIESNIMPKVLLVDDENDILDLIKYHLEKEGYIVKTAFNGIEGIEVAKKFSPDLILLDVMMPEMDGIETCIEFRKDPVLKNAIIAFLTARSEDYSQVAGLDSGADDYITKPIRPKVLLSRVKALLRRRGEISESAHIIEVGDIRIDKEKYLVTFTFQKIVFFQDQRSTLWLYFSNPF